MAVVINPTATATALSLLSIVQKFYRRTNIGTVPTSVLGSTDQQVLQILALLEEEGADLSGRGDWQALTFEAVHTTTATESQGFIETIATAQKPTRNAKFRYIKHNTIWDRTENLPVQVIDGPGWQAEKGFASTSPRYRARIRERKLYVTPTPPAGNTWAFEYVSWNWIINSAGTITYQYFNADTDEILFPEPIVLMGLRWRWKKEKGFDYAEDFVTYEKMIQNELGRQGIKRTLRADTMEKESIPGIVVSQGSWSL